MNKVAAMLVAAALLSPAYAREHAAPVKKPEAWKVTTKHSKKGQAPAGDPAISALRHIDYPWQTPA